MGRSASTWEFLVLLPGVLFLLARRVPLTADRERGGDREDSFAGRAHVRYASVVRYGGPRP